MEKTSRERELEIKKMRSVKIRLREPKNNKVRCKK